MSSRTLRSLVPARAWWLVVGWLAVVAAFALMVAQSQERSRDVLEQRQQSRASMAAGFVGAYVADQLDRERKVAVRRLTAPAVSEAEFQRTVAANGYEAAVLLDGRGRVLRVSPAKPALLGTDMTRRYRHLHSAVEGRPTVSDVVPSAARGVPVVAFAVPFRTPSGPRVFSGAQVLARTPLGAYLRSTSVVGARVWLLDRAGKVIAHNGRDAPLTARGALAPAHEELVMSRAVPGTPWRLVMRVPESRLYASIEGASRWLPWLGVVALGLVGLVVVGLICVLLAGRTRLSELNRRLKHLVRIDNLTGLYNHRHVDELLTRLVSGTRRHDLDLAVLVIDVDHFKRVNDEHGHQAGDRVLRHVAEVLRASLRAEDVVGRWGGEEFLAALPGSDRAGAVATAERVRLAIRQTPCPLPDGTEVTVSVTVGLAVWHGQDPEQLVREADRALYAGKAAGRDTVWV